MTAPPPIATYRLQFRNGMDFAKAAEIVPYLKRLGISHLYASPIFKARAGSTHGYDIVDPARLDPELGGHEGFEKLGQALAANGLGLLLDIVPNHLGVGADNPYWQDLLRWGQEAPSAVFFDVDWDARAGGTPGRILLPQLGAPYGEVLANGELKLALDQDPPSLDIAYYDNRYPLDPRTWAMALEGRLGDDLLVRLKAATPATFPTLVNDLAAAWEGLPATLDDVPAETLDALIEAQAWRLAYWRTGNAMLNWRRFFDITELVGVRVEEPEVFRATHALALDLYGKGQLSGLRIDHVDGLAKPGSYLEQLADAMRAARADMRPWILVEKILGEGEELPVSWPVAGTTGYETLNAILGLFVDPDGEAALNATYARMGGDPEGFLAVVRGAKDETLRGPLKAEMSRLSARLADLAANDPVDRDLPVGLIEDALVALVTAFPVYRTYGGDGRFTAEDEVRLSQALDDAEAAMDLPDPYVFRYLKRVFLDEGPDGAVTRALLTGFEQRTGPAMAKSLEDTAFYRWHRLVALNEVGGEPDRFGLSAGAAHAFFANLAERHPYGLIATATHDTKRGEDTRLRIAALSELAGPWGEEVAAWYAMNARLRTGEGEAVHPEPKTEYLFYQMLVGAFPPGGDVADAGLLHDLAERLVAYLEKACREAKLHTNWLSPNEAYETAVAAFVRGALDRDRSAEFLDRLRAFLDQIDPIGALSGLAQTVLKLTLPGVPDVYQGTEFWDLSTVDPDNRRPVDWDARAAALAKTTIDVEGWRDGRLKQALIARILEWRARHPDLFTAGRYRPLTIEGDAARHVFAFERVDADGTTAVVAVARLLRQRLGDRLPPPPDLWQSTTLKLTDTPLVSLLDGRRFEGQSLPLGDVFGEFPVAVLVSRS